MSKGERKPKPVAHIEDHPYKIASAIIMKVWRSGPHVPVDVFVRMGDVYALHQCYKSAQVWSITYPEDFVGSYTRRHSCETIAREIERAKLVLSSR